MKTGKVSRVKNSLTLGLAKVRRNLSGSKDACIRLVRSVLNRMA